MYNIATQKSVNDYLLEFREMNLKFTLAESESDLRSGTVMESPTVMRNQSGKSSTWNNYCLNG